MENGFNSKNERILKVEQW